MQDKQISFICCWSLWCTEQSATTWFVLEHFRFQIPDSTDSKPVMCFTCTVCRHQLTCTAANMSRHIHKDT